MRSIKSMPVAVSSSVRSGIILFDIARVVEELVFNSLDSGASKVSVFVALSTCYVKVEDDGSGITRDGLELLGERYATSKFYQLIDKDTKTGSFGFRGELLASISDVSLLEIVTKACGRPNGYRKVMKGSKCLYLGICDDRKDVGTTVVARDLFYNQPVRRKYIQSSPKVLESVKKCVLRIALVHSNLSFKVVDMESEDVLLCIHPSSPMSLMTSCFGIEVSNSLHKLNISDGKIKLSGYISGPCGNLTIKAFQYVYINSRFVCKGPVHKLVNQLAASFECWNQVKSVSGTLNRKRSRPQSYPVFVLNISCPRCFYDLTIEPSKTHVEFKDWVPVLTLLDEAIQQLWKGIMSYGESVELAVDRRGKDQMLHGDEITMSAEDLGDDNFAWNSTMEEKKCTFQNHPASPGLISSHLKIPNEEDNYTSHMQQYPTPIHHPPNYFEEQEHEMDFAIQTGKLVQSWDRSLAKRIKNCENEMYISDNNFSSVKDHFFLNEISTGERCSIRVDNSNFSSWWENDSFEGSMNISSGSAGIARTSDCLDSSDDEEMTGDVEKPFLKSCCLRQRVPQESSLFTDAGDDLQSDGFKMKKMWTEPYERVNISEIDSANQSFDFLSRTLWQDQASSFQHFPGFARKSDLSAEFDSLPVKSIPFCEESPDRNDVLEKRSSQENCTTSCSSSVLEDGVSDCFQRSYKLTNKFSPECMDKSTDGRDGLSLNSLGKSHKGIAIHKSQRDAYDGERERNFQFSNQRSRSRSAPPFHRSKRKFLALNCHISSIVNNGPAYPEAPEQLKSACVEDLLLDSRRDLKEDNKKIKTDERFEQSACFDVQGAALLTETISNEFQDSPNSWTKWRNCCPPTANNNKLHGIHDQNNILDISSGFLHLAGDFLVPASINKSCLDDATVLQQVDKKFIPVVAGRILAVVDQHAADERIQLDELRQRVLFGEGKTITFLEAEQELTLPEMGLQLLHNYAEEIKEWGWICNTHAQDRPFKRNLNILHKQPAVVKLIAVPCILGVNLSDVDLMEFLQQLAETDGSSTIPPSVLRVLNSKACRGAIMFGDSLLPSECSLIVEELKKTALCFQCAHGRPTTAPLVNLEALHKQIAKIALLNDDLNGLWHGLRRHKLTVERAAQRLSSTTR